MDITVHSRHIVAFYLTARLLVKIWSTKNSLIYSLVLEPNNKYRYE